MCQDEQKPSPNLKVSMSTYSFSFFPRRCLIRYSLCPAWLENIACLIVLEVGLSHQDGGRSTLPNPDMKLLQWKSPITQHLLCRSHKKHFIFNFFFSFLGKQICAKCELTLVWSWMWQSWPVRRQPSLWEWVEEAEDWVKYRRLCAEVEEGQEEAP